MSVLFQQALQDTIKYFTDSNIHTCLPGKVTKYNADNCSIEAQPLVRKVYWGTTAIDMPVIVSVPVVFPRTAKFHMTYPLEAGDGVLLLFSSRAIDEFLHGDGSMVTPDATRTFALTDAIAIPGLFPFSQGSKPASGSDMEIVFKDTKIVSDGTKVSVTASTVDMNSSVVPLTPLDGVVTGKCACAFIGAPHPVKSSSVRAAL